MTHTTDDFRAILRRLAAPGYNYFTDKISFFKSLQETIERAREHGSYSDFEHFLSTSYGMIKWSLIEHHIRQKDSKGRWIKATQFKRDVESMRKTLFEYVPPPPPPSPQLPSTHGTLSSARRVVSAYCRINASQKQLSPTQLSNINTFRATLETAFQVAFIPRFENFPPDIIVDNHPQYLEAYHVGILFWAIDEMKKEVAPSRFLLQDVQSMLYSSMVALDMFKQCPHLVVLWRSFQQEGIKK